MSEGQFKEHPRFERIVNTLAQQIGEVGDAVRDYEHFIRAWSSSVSDRQWVKVFERLGDIEEQGKKVRVRLHDVYDSFDSLIAEGGDSFETYCRDYPEIAAMLKSRIDALNPMQAIINTLAKAADRVAKEREADVESD